MSYYLILFILLISSPALGETPSPEASPPPSVLPESPRIESSIVPLDTPSPSESPVPTPSESPEEEIKVKVTDILVEGTNRTSGILLSIVTQVGEYVTKEDLLEDMKRVYGLGDYLDVQIRTEPYLDGVRVTFVCIENPILQKVILEGNSKIPTEELLPLFEDKIGKVINYEEIRTCLEALKKKYEEKNYNLVQIADVTTTEDGVLSLKILEGIIEEIKLVGNTKTKNYVILRELTTQTGDVFNIQAIQEDMRRVFNLNFFKDIGLQLEPSKEKMGYVVVVIKLEEKPTGAVNFGAGWNSRDKLVGTFSINMDNFLGRGQRIGIDVQVGKSSFYEVNWYNPWAFGKRISLGSAVFHRRTFNFFEDYAEERTGLEFTIGKPLFGNPITTPWRSSLTFRGENVHINDGSSKRVNLPEATITGKPSATDRVVGFDLTLSFDTRDIRMDPHHGWFNFVTVSPKGGPLNPLLGGDVTYTKFFIGMNRYMPVIKETTFAIGSRFGYLLGERLPTYDRFYSSGTDMLRGWPENDYFSGNRVWITSAEYRVPIVKAILQGVLFYDIGTFWNRGQQFQIKQETLTVGEKTYHLGFYSGYGLGLRVTTPLGPLRLDYGFPIGENSLKRGRFYFNIGQKF